MFMFLLVSISMISKVTSFGALQRVILHQVPTPLRRRKGRSRSQPQRTLQLHRQLHARSSGDEAMQRRSIPIETGTNALRNTSQQTNERLRRLRRDSSRISSCLCVRAGLEGYKNPAARWNDCLPSGRGPKASPGMRLLVLDASGGVGSFAVIITKS
jgi:hypothetical protein